jgi:hypothetical protein
MRILLDGPGGAAPRLEDADDFTSFSISAIGAPDAQRLSTAAAALGRAEGETHVFVEPFALVSLAGDRGRDPRWLERLSKMVAYAREHGWVDEREAMRAHVEWRDA